MTRSDLTAVAGVLVAVLALLYGAWQSADRRAEDRGAQQAIIRQLEGLVKAHQQLIDDTRMRLVDLERMSRYEHGEYRVPR